MAFRKGQPKPPGSGRTKGTPNDSPSPVGLRRFFDHGLTTAFKDFTRLRKKNPGAALKLWLDAAEYIEPKLARREIVGGDKPVLVERRIIQVVNEHKE